MNKPSTNDQTYTRWLICIVTMILAIVIVYTVFSQKQIERNAYYTVEHNAAEISHEISAYVKYANSSILLTSHLASQSLTQDELTNASEVLVPLTENTPFSFIEYIDKDGINATDRGATFDASDRVYYQEGIKGNTGIWINYHPKYSDEFLLNFYTPLYHRSKIVGVLTGAIGSKTDIEPLIQSTFFGERMIGFLCDENGQILSSTMEIGPEAHLVDSLNELGINQDGINSFYSHMANKDPHMFVIDGMKGPSIACVYVNEETNWSVVQLVSAPAFGAIIRRNLIGAYISTVLICFILFWFLFHIRRISKRNEQEIIEETERVVQNYEQILTSTAADTYKGIRRIDLETATSEYIYFEDGHVKSIKLGDWSTWLENQKNNIHPDDYDRIKTFLSIEHLRKLEKGITYRDNYKSQQKNKTGYYNTYTTTVSIAFLEGKMSALATTIDNTAAVVNEIEQKQLLASAASIYISMHVLDIKNDLLITLNSASHITNMIGDRRTNVFSILRDTMRKFTDEQFMDTMMEFIDHTTLNERMRDCNTLTLEFLGTTSGWCRARFIAVDYDENHNLNRVLWVVENIDAEKRKANQLLYLSETDLMTGIRNRGSGEKKIRELLVAQHEGMFFLLDADKFKSINDNYGHGVGDKVIIAIADCLKAAFSEKDIVLRLGGDEFAVFADGITDKETAINTITEFFNAIDHIDIPELGERKITISLGVSCKKKGDSLDFETLYRNADSCTYESKKIVGNCYTFFE